MDSRIPTGFNDEGFGSLQDCASLAAAGYCDSWFCPFCAYAGHCDRTCGYCGSSPTPKAPGNNNGSTGTRSTLESPFETVVVSGNAVVVDCPLSDTAILPIFIKPEPDGPRLELPNEFLQSSIEDQDLIIQGIKIIDVDAGSLLGDYRIPASWNLPGTFSEHNTPRTGATMSGNGTKARFDRKDGTMNPHFRGNGGGLLNVAIVAKHGRIKLSRAVEQLSFVNDGSVGSSVLNFTGHIADINRALDKCVYSAKPHFNTHNTPPDEVSIIVSDLGKRHLKKMSVLFMVPFTLLSQL